MYLGGSKWLDTVGKEVNDERFLGLEKEEVEEEVGSRAERTKCCRTDSGRFSLCSPLLSSVALSVQAFVEARAASRNARVLPASPPTCSPLR